MIPPLPKARDFVLRLLLVVAFNVAIAGVIALLAEHQFLRALLLSESIGLSIFGFSVALVPLRRRWPDWRWSAAVSIPVGGAFGLTMGALIGGPELRHAIFDSPQQFLASMACAVIFGVFANYFFYSRDAMLEGAARLQAEALRRAAIERSLLEAQLKLLQAQMEPHFLFNTLSNVLSLIEARPAEARRMLHNLTSYLRGTLQRTREGATTLGDEADLLRAYLEIQGVRMGARLRFSLEVPGALREVPLPPLLLQPLVENAVRHGLEPRLEGGEISVRASREDGALQLEVRDTGVGLTGDPAPGVGLSNVRARLRALYGEGFAMQIHPNGARGLCVQLSVPVAGPPRAAEHA